MTVSIEVTIDAVDVDSTVGFWLGALRYERMYERAQYVVLVPPAGDPRPRLVIQGVDAVPPGKSPVHLDLRVDDPDAEVARLTTLGAHVAWSVDETNAGLTRWTTMTDPGGTHFCVCPARQE